MDELGVDRRDGGVYFGQLLGMADFLTFPVSNRFSKQYRIFVFLKYISQQNDFLLNNLF